MRIVDFLTIVFGASLTSVHSKPAYGYGSLPLTDDIIRVKKRNEESTSGYLEQCGPVAFPMAQRGVVNVLAFLDSSWPYSHRQAIMLKMLNDRLRRSGLPDALFFVVNVDPSFLSGVGDSEDDIEKEAWLGVSPEEIESFSDIDKTADSLELSMTPDIRLIQDNVHLGIWKNLRGSRDQVLVIDRCGKLTYQVIVPWSILHFPYVKAAILSTYKDEPCGPCDIVRNATGLLNRNENRTAMMNSTTEDYFQNDRESVIVGDLPVTTESYRREKEDTSTFDVGPESFASSTSEYRLGSSQDTNEETSIGSFLEIRITTESTTTPNLISKEDNCTAEFESEKSDEFPTSSASTDLSGGIYLHDTEDVISASVVTSDTTDSINNVTSGSTVEDTLSSEEVTIARLMEKEETLTKEHYLHDTEDAISASFITSDTTVSINNVTSGSTTEDTLSSEEATIGRLPKKEETLTKEHHLHDTEDAISASFITSDTTVSINNVTSGSTTEDASSSDAVMIARLPENEEISMNDNYFNRKEENIGTIASSHLVTNVTSNSEDNYVSTFDTIVGNVEAAMEETSISSVDEMSSLEDRSINETRVEKTDAAIFSSGSFDAMSQIEYSSVNYDSTDGTIDRTTVETLRVEEDWEKNEDSHSPQDGSKTSEEKEEIGESFEIPIRIIMHAPHFHVDGESTRMHEYLVLKTGSSDRHGHLASRDATRLYSGPQDFHEKSDAPPNEDIEAKLWPMINVIYNKNESPGLYGEVADFWRGTGSQEVYEDTEDTAKPENQQIAEEAGAEVELWKKPSKANNNNPPETVSDVDDKSTLTAGDSSAAAEATGIPLADVTGKNPTSIEEFNAEEETRNRLIAHYSKLLPWIYYVLDK